MGVQVIKLKRQNIVIKEMLEVLGKHGITSLFVEGGAEVHGSFLQERAFQQVICYIAPKLLGGRLAPTSFGGPGIEHILEAINLEMKQVDRIGRDLRIIAEPGGDE